MLSQIFIQRTPVLNVAKVSSLVVWEIKYFNCLRGGFAKLDRGIYLSDRRGIALPL